MDRLMSLLLRLTPEERIELAHEVAARLTSSDDAAVEAEWMRALERRFADDDPEQLPLWSDRRPDAR